MEDSGISFIGTHHHLLTTMATLTEPNLTRLTTLTIIIYLKHASIPWPPSCDVPETLRLQKSSDIRRIL